MSRQFVFLLTVSFATVCIGFAFAGKDNQNNENAQTEQISTPLSPAKRNTSCPGNATECDINANEIEDPEYARNPMIRTLYENREMLQRAFYVLMAVTAVIVLYFVIKNVLLRRKQSKTVKYGIISTPGSDLEMQPLDQGDDDDDMTLYEARATKLK